MVEFTEFMSVGLDKCAPEGPGTGPNRQAVFDDLVQLWNRQKETIKQMNETELRQQLECP